jgi:hypothetical protein
VIGKEASPRRTPRGASKINLPTKNDVVHPAARALAFAAGGDELPLKQLREPLMGQVQQVPGISHTEVQLFNEEARRVDCELIGLSLQVVEFGPSLVGARNRIDRDRIELDVRGDLEGIAVRRVQPEREGVSDVGVGLGERAPECAACDRERS